MLRSLRPHRPSPAMVVAMLALFVALGGSSYAAVMLKKNSVRSVHIKNGQVKAADLGSGAVTGARLANGSVTSTKLGSGSVTGAKVQDGSLGAADLAPGTTGFKSVKLRQATRQLAVTCTPSGMPGFNICSGSGSLTVNCAAAERAASGGVGTIAGALPVTIVGNGPVVSNGAPVGWKVDVSVNNPFSPVSATSVDVPMHAICIG